MAPVHGVVAVHQVSGSLIVQRELLFRTGFPHEKWASAKKIPPSNSWIVRVRRTGKRLQGGYDGKVVEKRAANREGILRSFLRYQC